MKSARPWMNLLWSKLSTVCCIERQSVQVLDQMVTRMGMKMLVLKMAGSFYIQERILLVLAHGFLPLPFTQSKFCRVLDKRLLRGPPYYKFSHHTCTLKWELSNNIIRTEEHTGIGRTGPWLCHCCTLTCQSRPHSLDVLYTLSWLWTTHSESRTLRQDRRLPFFNMVKVFVSNLEVATVTSCIDQLGSVSISHAVVWLCGTLWIFGHWR